jgi:hypothetical protein
VRSGGFLLALLAFELLAMPLARAADGELCAQAIAHNEAAGVLPAGLLTAVAVSESGRYDRDRRRVAPWPWTVNNAGDGRYFPTKDEAIHHVERLRAAGERNIDVGCMQVNLMHHPDAFASLEEAFEPSRNSPMGRGSWMRSGRRHGRGIARSSGTTPTRSVAAPTARRCISAGHERRSRASPTRARRGGHAS